MSVWWGLGERIGYAIGGVIFGPTVMMARRRRKTRRRALAGWLAPTQYTRLTAPVDTVRWLVVDRREDELTFSIEVHLDPDDFGFARVAVSYERLPDRAAMRVERHAIPEQEPELAAIIRAIPGAWTAIQVQQELLTIESEAPMSADEWDALVRGATTIAAWLARHFRAGYR